MPLKQCTLPDGKSGWKYGDSGKCYESKQKAILQGVAISQNSDEKLELSKDDVEELCKEFDMNMDKFEPMVKDESNHCLFGMAYVAKELDGEQVYDHSGEFIKKENFEDMEMATYLFNIAYRQSDIRHSCIAKGYLIDSMVFTPDKVEAMRKAEVLDGDIALGVWMGFWFPEDEDWNEICKMDAPMFSLYGSAIKELVEEVEDE